MKTVVLCGGRGTRLDDLGKSVPKALVPIGGKPILWHLLKIYERFGHTDFILCLGYLGEMIRESVVRFDEPWSIEAIDTGLDTNTGGRLKRVEHLLPRDAPFFVTYGDGLADVDLEKLEIFHRGHGRTATLTAVHPVSSFGILDIVDDDSVSHFVEKPVMKEWINGGFFCFEPAIMKLLTEDSVLEKEPLSRLAEGGELKAFRHDGFWKCMDTYKDNLEFEHLWKAGAPWQHKDN
jgi:glucose-1-phosphate cytidylyltransferase